MTTDLRPAARGAPLPEDTPATESDRESFIWDYFKGKGVLTDEQIAGIIGNFEVEDPGLDPAGVQNGGGPGHGIAQWETGSRWDHDAGDNVVEFAKNHQEDPFDLQTQLDFAWYELPTNGLEALQRTTTVEDATTVFQDRFERPNRDTLHTDRRIAAAKAALAAHGGLRQITQGEGSVRVGTALQPAAHVGSPDSGGGQIAEGHPTVLIGTAQMPFARVGDRTRIRSGTIVDGDGTVLLGGDPGSGGPDDGGPGAEAAPP